MKTLAQALAVLLALCAARQAVAHGPLVLTDPSGAAIAGAAVEVLSIHGSRVAEGLTDEDGRLPLDRLQRGAYILKIRAAGFEPSESVLEVSAAGLRPSRVTLSVSPLRSAISVTSARGSAETVQDAPSIVCVHERESFLRRPSPTIGHALENQPGTLVQQTTLAQVSPFLRGLTGYHVLNLIDGVRFNNSTFRSGPNQYLAFVEPAQAKRLEVTLGPTGSQYGSDGLGGAIHVLTAEPRLGSGSRPALAGDVHGFSASADPSAGGSARIFVGLPRLAWMAGSSFRRHNDLRAGGGEDSHHVFRRLFGLPGAHIRELVGSRLQDTAFTQHGAQTKLALRMPRDQSFTTWYQRSDISGARGYKDLWGGLGRLQSAFGPQALDFGYARYEKLGAGPLDSLSATVSLNAQTDGSVRQAFRMSDPITTDRTRVISAGYAVQGTKHVGSRHALVFGGEAYRDHIASRRLVHDPRTGQSTQGRALYPDGSRYTTAGLFAQDSMELLPQRLRAVAGARFTGVRFQALDGSPSQSFHDLTFHTSLVWSVSRAMALHALIGRGFRAPNVNDLGAVGLNDLGFEIPAAEAVAAGALLATSAGESALSTGRALGGLSAERLFNYELGWRLSTRRAYARVHVFDAELLDPIVRRTLLFPAARVPAALLGLPVTPLPTTPEQAAQGVRAVATAMDPRAVKAFVNDGHARYSGVDSLLKYSFSPRWILEAGYSFLAGRDLSPNRPVRRLPPQQGHAGLRYTPSGGRLWLALEGAFAGEQKRLSGGDLDDERIGASRSRRDIADFFSGGLVQPFLAPGGVFAPTGETLAQIQQRLLPSADASARLPLFRSTPGWLALNLAGGVPLGEGLEISFGVANLLDRNYRVHGSGIDAPGRNVFAGFRWRF